MQQVVDLQNSAKFQAMGIELLSLSPDPLDAWANEAASLGIRTPLLSDAGNQVADAYGVMQWQMPSGEPGHTFVLVDEQGRVAWVRDYGAPEHGGLMYVEPNALLQEIAKHVEEGQ
jgi:peroxiredoxin